MSDRDKIHWLRKHVVCFCGHHLSDHSGRCWAEGCDCTEERPHTGLSLLLDCDREKERADRAEHSLAETAQLMVHAKDFARNAAPILRLHKQLVAAAQAGDDKAVNRIVAELGLIESPL